MFLSCKLTVNSLTLNDSVDITGFLNSIITGSSVIEALSVMTSPQLIDHTTVSHERTPDTTWQLSESGDILESPCVDASKVKRVKLIGAVNAISAALLDSQDNVVLSDTATANFPRSLFLVVRTCKRSLMIGTYDSQAAALASGVLFSEYTVNEHSSMATDPNIMPVVSFNLNIADLNSTTSLTNRLRFANIRRKDGSYITGTSDGLLLLGDTLFAGSGRTVPTVAYGEQYLSNGDLRDMFIPFGLYLTGTAGSTGLPTVIVSVTDMCGIYFHQGMGNRTDLYLPVTDIVEVEGTNYICFYYFAIPLN